MNMRVRTAFLVLLGVSLATNPVLAVPIPVPNFSFENPDLPDGLSTGTETSGNTTEVPGWTVGVAVTGSALVGIEDPNGRYPGDAGNNSPLPGTAHAGQMAFISLLSDAANNNGSLTTTSPVATTQINTVYTLTVALGDDADLSDSTDAVVRIDLLANGLFVASATTTLGTLTDGTFTDLSTPPYLAPVSGLELDIRILLTSAGEGGFGNFDNVRLDATAPTIDVAAPASFALLGAGVLALCRRRRR